MKIRQGFEMRQVGDEYVVITVGDAVNGFNGMIKLNNTGVFIWKQLQNGTEYDKLLDSFAKEFSIDRSTAENDINLFIDNLKQANCIDE